MIAMLDYSDQLQRTFAYREVADETVFFLFYFEVLQISNKAV